MATDFLERGRFAADAVAQGGILDRLRLQVIKTYQRISKLLVCAGLPDMT